MHGKCTDKVIQKCTVRVSIEESNQLWIAHCIRNLY